MTLVRSLVKKAKKIQKPLVLLGLSFALIGCASTPNPVLSEAPFDHILGYAASLPPDHPDLPENLLEISDEVRNLIKSRFTARDKHTNAHDLAYWLVDENGHNMEYDLEANLAPSDAFEQGRGNCLSFTLLLIKLAEELGIELQVNQVDLPDTWGVDAQQDLIFYRHVNAIFKTVRSTQIFDLAMEEYRQGYPQRVIKKQHGAALLFSNIGIQKLQNDELYAGLHYLKLSASLFPKNPDMWINLAAAYKRNGDLEATEKIYLHAFSLSDRNSLAASNLARLYTSLGRKSKAERFTKLAKRARRNNPYMQYRNAQKHFDLKEYKLAKKAIKRAIRLHDLDPHFYELSSLIKQTYKDYVGALLDLEKAHNLSTQLAQRQRYYKKVELIAAHAKRLAEKQKNRRPDDRAVYSKVQVIGENY